MKIEIFTSSISKVVSDRINKLVLSKKNIVIVDIKYSTAYGEGKNNVVHSALVMYKDD